MPLELIVHQATCPTRKRKTCDCQFELHLMSTDALEACEGDSSRLEIGRITPPQREGLPDPITAERSQAKRHTRVISE